MASKNDPQKKKKTRRNSSPPPNPMDSPSLAPRPHLPASVYTPNPFPLDPTQPDGRSVGNPFLTHHETTTAKATATAVVDQEPVFRGRTSSEISSLPPSRDRRMSMERSGSNDLLRYSPPQQQSHPPPARSSQSRLRSSSVSGRDGGAGGGGEVAVSGRVVIGNNGERPRSILSSSSSDEGEMRSQPSHSQQQPHRHHQQQHHYQQPHRQSRQPRPSGLRQVQGAADFDDGNEKGQYSSGRAVRLDSQGMMIMQSQNQNVSPRNDRGSREGRGGVGGQRPPMRHHDGPGSGGEDGDEDDIDEEEYRYRNRGQLVGGERGGRSVLDAYPNLLQHPASPQQQQSQYHRQSSSQQQQHHHHQHQQNIRPATQPRYVSDASRSTMEFERDQEELEYYREQAWRMSLQQQQILARQQEQQRRQIYSADGYTARSSLDFDSMDMDDRSEQKFSSREQRIGSSSIPLSYPAGGPDDVPVNQSVLAQQRQQPQSAVATSSLAPGIKPPKARKWYDKFFNPEPDPRFYGPPRGSTTTNSVISSGSHYPPKEAHLTKENLSRITGGGGGGTGRGGPDDPALYPLNPSVGGHSSQQGYVNNNIDDPYYPGQTVQTEAPPNKRRMVLRLISLFSSLLAIGFITAAGPISKGKGSPFTSSMGIAIHYIVSILSSIVSCLFLFNYFSRRLRRQEKMKRHFLFGLDILLAILWAGDIFIAFTKFGCPVGGNGGWCDMYNISIFLGIVALISFIAAVIWDCWGSFDHSKIVDGQIMAKNRKPFLVEQQPYAGSSGGGGSNAGSTSGLARGGRGGGRGGRGGRGGGRGKAWW